MTNEEIKNGELALENYLKKDSAVRVISKMREAKKWRTISKKTKTP